LASPLSAPTCHDAGRSTLTHSICALQDKHTSTLVMSNLQTTGDMCFGAFVAGIVVTLAHLPGRAYTEFLCLFTAIGLIPFATTRARYLKSMLQAAVHRLQHATLPCLQMSSVVHLSSKQMTVQQPSSICLCGFSCRALLLCSEQDKLCQAHFAVGNGQHCMHAACSRYAWPCLLASYKQPGLT